MLICEIIGLLKKDYCKMPTYDYKCNDCGHQFEAFQSMKDDPLTMCPNCGGTVARLIGGGNGFIFKGSGFYITDYRSKDYKKAQIAETSSKKPTDSKTKNNLKKTDTT